MERSVPMGCNDRIESREGGVIFVGTKRVK